MHLSLIFLSFLGVVKIDAQYWDWAQTQVYIYKKGFELPIGYDEHMFEEGDEQ